MSQGRRGWQRLAIPHNGFLISIDSKLTPHESREKGTFPVQDSADQSSGKQSVGLGLASGGVNEGLDVAKGEGEAL